MDFEQLAAHKMPVSTAEAIVQIMVRRRQLDYALERHQSLREEMEPHIELWVALSDETRSYNHNADQLKDDWTPVIRVGKMKDDRDMCVVWSQRTRTFQAAALIDITEKEYKTLIDEQKTDLDYIGYTSDGSRVYGQVLPGEEWLDHVDSFINTKEPQELEVTDGAYAEGEVFVGQVAATSAKIKEALLDPELNPGAEKIFPNLIAKLRAEGQVE